MTLWDSLFTHRNISTPTSSAAHDQDPGRTAMAPLADHTHAEEQTSRSGLRTVLVFSAILVPCAAIPYILLRRQCYEIMKEISMVRVANESFAREMRRFTTADAPKTQKGVEEILKAVREHKTKIEATAAALKEVKESLAAARARMDDLQAKADGLEKNIVAKVQGVDRALSKALRAGFEQHKMRDEWQEEIKLSLATLATESTRWRSTVAEDVRETGMSLANLAGFVEEVERREGWTPLPNDGRGIGRMRNLAKLLEEHGQSLEQDDRQAEEDTEPSPSKEAQAKHNEAPAS